MRTGPITDIGSGELISVRGEVRRVTPESSDDYFNSLNVTELALNLADATKYLVHRQHDKDQAMKALQDRVKAHNAQISFVKKLKLRLETIIDAREK